MPLSIRCQCGKSYRVPDSAAGKKFRCKNCAAAISVPRSDRNSTRKKHQTQAEPENLLDHLIGDDEGLDASADQPPPPPARSAGVETRPVRARVEREFEPGRYGPRETGPLSVIAILGVAMLAVAFSHPPFAAIILKVMLVIGGFFVLIGYVWLLVLARQEGLGTALLVGIFPPYLLIFAVINSGETKDSLIWIAIGLTIAIVTAGVGLLLESIHGILILPSFIPGVLS